jgi:redox-sensitive bicupin YhaK (pirin superfamily)
MLRKGSVQHTTVGRGMWHSEINNRPDEPMRFIQVWFLPSELGREPSVEQKAVEQKDRTNAILPLVSNTVSGALGIVSDAAVSSSFLVRGHAVTHRVAPGWGSYLYVLEGGPVLVNEKLVPALAAVMVTEEQGFTVSARNDAELLLVDTKIA